ncbi:MAG: cyclic nucleotide-binding domain-containing protein [Saccharofermentans sp.]|nr:cyclic nucleotide-binding domain-containing protein [Saccharofermentans sp.]
MSTIEKTFADGEIIIKEGDTGSTFFQLLEGKAAVYKNYGKDDQVQIAIFEPGQYFGEMAVIESYPRSATVVAEGGAKVFEIEVDGLTDYIKENPDKILVIMKLLGGRIKTMTEDCNEAKTVLDGIRKANSSSNYDSFFNNMMKQSIFLSAKNFRLERPSVESLREASKNVTSAGSDNVETYNYGTIIFKQGEIGKCMYIVHSGRVNIYSNYGEVNEVKLNEVVPVACFGEMGMLSDEPRDTTAVAEESGTEVEIIRPEDLEGIFKTSPAKIDMILKNQSYRLRSITYDYFKACQEIYAAKGKED